MSTTHLPRPPSADPKPARKPKRTKLDASQVVEGLPLFVGSMPGRPITKRDGFSLFVPCAAELLPRAAASPAARRSSRPTDESELVGAGVRLHTCALVDDARGLPPGEHAALMGAVVSVKRELEAGGRVLVACARGLNRGPLICALVVLSLSRLSAEQVIDLLRGARGKDALSNPSFVYLIGRFYGAWSPGQQGGQK